MTIKKLPLLFEIPLGNVEKALCDYGVTGLIIHPATGRRNHCNTYSKDGLVVHKQVDVYTTKKCEKSG
ncbi:MAG: hypothetical protein P8M49_01345 [Thalassotalea sp.]|nr:hypothetical protein [Thalassotalea sp.]MDG2392127.1 hypothetical protein [Thalassotalea sp.]